MTFNLFNAEGFGDGSISTNKYSCNPSKVTKNQHGKENTSPLVPHQEALLFLLRLILDVLIIY